jgi:transposase InsO family protein
MISITSIAKFRQRVIRYSRKNGITAAGIRHKVSRQAIYEWKAKYDGHWHSLRDKSHRPHSNPKQHTEEEINLIIKYWQKNKDDRIILWGKIREKGYKRQYGSMLRVIKRLNLVAEIDKRKGYKAQLYKRADYPGQKVQMDVKFVPSYCVSNGQKYYQYTAIDECTRIVFRELYDEHSTYSSKDFLIKLIEAFPFPIREIQTDNGTEFTNALLVKTCIQKSLFEQALEDMDIIYHRIRIATPRHNGKVERQHRIDEKRFYRKMKMYSLDDGRKQIKIYNNKSNSYPKICLSFKSPNQVWEQYAGVM